METIEQKHDCTTDTEHNGCVGHPITNMLMSAEPVALSNDGIQPGDDGHGYAAQEPDAAALPPEMMAEFEAAFGQALENFDRAVGQIAATDERTAHLVINVERLSRGLDDAHAKLDRILNHFKVA